MHSQVYENARTSCSQQGPAVTSYHMSPTIPITICYHLLTDLSSYGLHYWTKPREKNFCTTTVLTLLTRASEVCNVRVANFHVQRQSKYVTSLKDIIFTNLPFRKSSVE